MFKIPSIIFDIGIAVIIYYFVSKKVSSKTAIIASTIWLFNPISWYNSSVWGQTDSIVNFLGLLAIMMLLNKRFIQFCFWFCLSLLFKGSLGVFILPLAFIVYLQKYNISTILKGLVVALFTVAAVGIWFHPRADFWLWIIDLYRYRILPGEIGSLSANAFNFWWLVDSGPTLDSKNFFGLTARVWGVIIYAVSIILLLFKKKQNTLKSKVLLLLALSSFSAFLFMTRIHPRYLYPVFPVLTIYTSFNRSILKVLVILSVVHLLNIYYLFWIPDIDIIKGFYIKPIFTNILAITGISIFLFLYSTFFKSYEK
jgi:dolichyl-phosphate-mannose-protein mannosyltransferase